MNINYKITELVGETPLLELKNYEEAHRLGGNTFSKAGIF